MQTDSLQENKYLHQNVNTSVVDPEMYITVSNMSYIIGAFAYMLAFRDIYSKKIDKTIKHGNYCGTYII